MPFTLPPNLQSKYGQQTGQTGGFSLPPNLQAKYGSTISQRLQTDGKSSISQALQGFESDALKQQQAIRQPFIDYAQRVGAGYMSATKDIIGTVQTGAEKMGKGDILSGVARAGLGAAGAFSRAVFTPITEAIAPLISPIIQKAAGIPQAQQVLGKINDWSKQHPEAAQNLKDIIDIVSAYGAGEIAPSVEKAGAKVATGVISEVKGVVEKVGTRLVERQAVKATESTWNMIQPELTKLEQAAAVKSGKITQEGMLKTLKQIPKGRDLEMIKTATPFVSNAKNELEAVANMKEGITNSAVKVREGLKESDAIWNKNELKYNLNKIKEPITVKSDITLHNTFKNLNRAVFDLANKANKKIIGLLDVRQRFDDLIEKEFGAKIYSKDNPLSTTIKDYRRTLNDLIESRIPEGKLPDGLSFKGELKKQSLLYDAIDNTAPKVDKLGSNVITQWIKDNPKKVQFVKWAAILYGGEKALKAVGTPFLP